jgi:deoxyribose-phosphate aldolase
LYTEGASSKLLNPASYARYGLTNSREASQAVKAGAKEIDMVLNIGALKSRDYSAVYRDIVGVQGAVRSSRPLLKVILETCLLSKPEITFACYIATLAGVDFVKTSTGFSSGGAKVEDVMLMRKSVQVKGSNNKVSVKASGGIRTLADAIKLIEAGATRLGIGSTGSISILGELKVQPDAPKGQPMENEGKNTEY